jgi:glycosyltransferase involved in cell wall biosynthesis
MRGLFLSSISADYPGNRGVLNKIEYQRAALAELVGTVDVVYSSVRGPLLNGERIAEYPLTRRAFSPLNHYVLFYRYVWKHCHPADYDFLYIRYPFALPSFVRFLRATTRASPDTKIIVEVPTFPYRQELRSPKQRVFLALDDLGVGHLKEHVDATVGFFGHSEIFGIPCIQTANGIDVDQIPVVRKRRLAGPSISMIVAANLSRWHGVDRLLRGLADYINRTPSRRVTLDIAGDGDAAQDLRKLCGELGVENCVSFQGMRTGEDLDALFAKSDLAISSLGMHRLGLRRSSSLKAREYCARGVPFVLASDDPDFPEGIPFVHRVPADESAIDVAAMVAFVEELHARNPNYVSEMREYAETRLTWRTKFKPVVHYLRTGQLVDDFGA